MILLLYDDELGEIKMNKGYTSKSKLFGRAFVVFDRVVELDNNGSYIGVYNNDYQGRRVGLININDGTIKSDCNQTKPFKELLGDYDKVEVATIVQELVDIGVVKRLPTADEQKKVDESSIIFLERLNGLD